MSGCQGGRGRAPAGIDQSKPGHERIPRPAGASSVRKAKCKAATARSCWRVGSDLGELLIQTVRSAYPAHEHDQFIAHLCGLLGLWVTNESSRLQAA